MNEDNNELHRKRMAKINEIKDQMRREEEKKKENQYDYKQKEKELNEHMGTVSSKTVFAANY